MPPDSQQLLYHVSSLVKHICSTNVGWWVRCAHLLEHQLFIDLQRHTSLPFFFFPPCEFVSSLSHLTNLCWTRVDYNCAFRSWSRCRTTTSQAVGDVVETLACKASLFRGVHYLRPTIPKPLEPSFGSTSDQSDQYYRWSGSTALRLLPVGKLTSCLFLLSLLFIPHLFLRLRSLFVS